ncbi:hypothetical protein C4K03_3624 [Pseudomonas synxantha]|uniref:Uncharacterized protein n=1 Tax=Pseudomonas synxantha TaxID=47883 RepID=A0A3G7U8V9_9PSED|nr:hypothetical protein [Pseudomonas synxantha]AZE55777.1 hypothetical protein C4K03_3624 [Pseudomonas synxantha]
MSSINASIPFIPTHPPVSKSTIDNDTPRHNPLEKNKIGDDAEVSDGKGGWKNAGDHYRADFNRKRIDEGFPSSDKKTGDNSQVNTRPPFPNMLPTDEKANDNSQVNTRLPFPNMLPTNETASDNSQVNTRRPFPNMLPIDEKPSDNSQVNTRLPFPNMLPTDETASDNSLININLTPIDFEIKSDGNDGWVKA